MSGNSPWMRVHGASQAQLAPRCACRTCGPLLVSAQSREASRPGEGVDAALSAFRVSACCREPPRRCFVSREGRTDSSGYVFRGVCSGLELRPSPCWTSRWWVVKYQLLS